MLTVICSRNHFRCRIIARLRKQLVCRLGSENLFIRKPVTYVVRLQVLTMKIIKVIVFWHVAPCSLVEIDASEAHTWRWF
jgi:hypothetical protein